MARRLLRNVAIGGVVVLSAAAALPGGFKHSPPNSLPILSDEVPSRKVQVAALAGSSNASPFDILVIGGGATGTGVAVDAATRGLRVALVEREDFGAGTSSRSTKLVHGGVRYLEKAVLQQDLGQLKLVFHALAERAHILKNAPHLSWPLPTMTPCYSWPEVPYYWAGLKAYDLVAGRAVLHLSRFCSAKESLELFPTLAHTLSDGRKLKGTVVYYDGQMDDARLNTALATTAARAGAVILNHVEAVELKKDEITGKVTGAVVEDKLSRDKVDVYAKVVVNATGPFSDSIRHMSDKDVPSIISPSSGVHVVLPDYYSSQLMGLIVPKTKDGRVIFMLPWLGRTVAGTTDSATTITMRPEPREEDVAFILDAIGEYLNFKVRSEDVLSAWSGIRPLAMDPTAKDTASISRDHVIIADSNGLVTITGGKWTTYRSMAEDTVDIAIKTGRLSNATTCVTEYLPLTGAEDYDPALFTRVSQQYVRMAQTRRSGTTPKEIDSEIAKHLTHAYGDKALDVASIAQNEMLGRKLVHGYPFLEAEVVFSARHEYCESAVDFIARRSRLAFLDIGAANKALPRVIELLAVEHKWDRSRKREELKDATSFLATFKVSGGAVH